MDPGSPDGITDSNRCSSPSVVVEYARVEIVNDRRYGVIYVRRLAHAIAASAGVTDTVVLAVACISAAITSDPVV
jgi:hypothetical protein